CRLRALLPQLLDLGGPRRHLCRGHLRERVGARSQYRPPNPGGDRGHRRGARLPSRRSLGPALESRARLLRTHRNGRDVGVAPLSPQGRRPRRSCGGGPRRSGTRIMTDTPKDNAGVVAPPPMLLAGFLAAGFLLDAIWPTAVLGHPWRYWIGGLLFLLGALLMTAGVSRFNRAGTNVPTHRPTTALVTDGPY